MRKILSRVIKRFGHYRTDEDLAEEMRVHAVMEAEDHLARGVSEREAKRVARVTLGSSRAAIEKVRDGEILTAVEGWYRDFVLGWRALRNNPVFSVTAILTLALGIGVNTAIFSLLYGLVLRPLPTSAPSELYQVGLASPARDSAFRGPFVTSRLLDAFRRNLTSFRDISGWTGWEAVLEDHQGSLRADPVGLVTGNAFQVVPLQPYRGRLLAPFDDLRGGPRQGWPVVLSYGFWSDHYGKDPAIVGKQIRISGTMVTVVGVLPPGFGGVWPGTDMRLYLPLQFANVLAGEDVLNQPNSSFSFSAIGRLQPGVSAAKAKAELARLQKGLLAENVPPEWRHLRSFEGGYLCLNSARHGVPNYITRTYAKPLAFMQGLVGVVLLLCCVNVGGLLLSKVYARQREFAVRTALGAPVSRLVRQYLVESLLLAAGGSALGALLAWRGDFVFLHFFRDPMMGEAMEVPPDGATFCFAGGLAVLATLLFGLWPAWRAGHADPGELLKARTSLGGNRHRAGRILVPIQVALSLVLVILASLLSQSVLKLRSERTGFDTDHVTIQTSRFSLLKLKGEAELNLYQRMVDRLNQMPDVRSAAVTSKTPMTGEEVMSRFQALGSGPNRTEESLLAFNDIGPGYFQTMRTRLIAGREFAKQDRSLDVCLLNEAAARFLFPHKEALDRYVRALDEREFPAGTTCRVIGIAEDAKFSDVRQAPPRTIYFPLSLPRMDSHLGNLVFLINAGSKPAAIAAFRQALAENAPTLPLVTFVTLREQMDAALGSKELITLLSNFFGIVALLLSALGLYGLLSASVAQRTSEMGLRAALGADRRRVLRLVLREALVLVGFGMGLGVFSLLFAIRLVRAMLHGVSAYDPWTLLAVVSALTMVTVLAALVPAWRAATVDPIEALRA